MNNPYYNPYLTNQNNILPPPQILQANGEQSVKALKMSPNSSVLIADSTAPIVWKCISDSLGNVTAEPFDIIPHKSQEQIEKDNLIVAIQNIEARLQNIEALYEKSTSEWATKPDAKSNDAEFATNKKNDAGRKKSAGASKSDDE